MTQKHDTEESRMRRSYKGGVIGPIFSIMGGTYVFTTIIPSLWLSQIVLTGLVALCLKGDVTAPEPVVVVSIIMACCIGDFRKLLRKWAEEDIMVGWTGLRDWWDK